MLPKVALVGRTGRVWQGVRAGPRVVAQHLRVREHDALRVAVVAALRDQRLLDGGAHELAPLGEGDALEQLLLVLLARRLHLLPRLIAALHLPQPRLPLRRSLRVHPFSHRLDGLGLALELLLHFDDAILLCTLRTISPARSHEVRIRRLQFLCVISIPLQLQQLLLLEHLAFCQLLHEGGARGERRPALGQRAGHFWHGGAQLAVGKSRAQQAPAQQRRQQEERAPCVFRRLEQIVARAVPFQRQVWFSLNTKKNAG